ncbi:MAG: molybdopterin-guanine dinucleotide biosynthesis protein B [Thiogranum sp.]|nr:molybdopterin-guanine dinucleotide biosynthesis protein B [Thiogranum sp.]
MDDLFTSPPVIGFAAYSGSGKTTLLTAMLPLLKAKGIRTGVIKHSHHNFEIDRPGKDSFLLRKAGALQMLIASPFRTVLIREHYPETEPRLDHLLELLDRSALDLILVEGFRHVEFPKLEIHRTATQKPFLHPGDLSIIALITDQIPATDLPCLDINNPVEVVSFIQDYITSTQSGNSA